MEIPNPMQNPHQIIQNRSVQKKMQNQVINKNPSPASSIRYVTGIWIVCAPVVKSLSTFFEVQHKLPDREFNGAAVSLYKVNDLLHSLFCAVKLKKNSKHCSSDQNKRKKHIALRTNVRSF